MMLNKRIRNTSLYYSLIIVLGIFLLSCEKGDPTDCFKNTGEDITETRAISSFNKIVLEDNINLVLTQSDAYSIKVHGGKNVLKKVRTDIDNEVLYIKNNNSCNWMRSFDREITVYANIDLLNQIEYRGSGDITSTNEINSDSLLLDVWEGAGKVDLKVDVYRNYIYFHIGTADIYYSGHAHLSYITASSFGPVKADELSTVFTYINNEGSNDCYIRAGLRIEATIKNIGNIYYKGNPEIQVDSQGSGKLIDNN